MSKISIAIDAMGGDNSPDKTIEGIKIFIDKYKSQDDFILNVFGNKTDIETKLKKFNIFSNHINIIHSEKLFLTKKLQ